MPKSDEKFKHQLIERYVAGQATLKELEAFFGILSGTALDALIEKHMDREIFALREEQQLLFPVKRNHRWKYLVAASFVIILSVSVYFSLHVKSPQQQIAQNRKHDIAPGSNKATLTLANGQKIILTKGLNGKLAQQGSTVIQVNNQNAVAYTSSAANANPTVQYNTLSTAKGEQSPYPLILADGSKVWLDAASSITFPTEFNRKDRLVTITGEAYLEVVHNAAHPFKINVKEQTIEDIGTKFNINAYDDEPYIRTTLLEGSVKISSVGLETILKPGQQSALKGNSIIISSANTEEAIAWKNGLFKFNKTDIKEVMRQISRWYNVDIQYEGAAPKRVLSGEMYRNINASEALQILNYASVNFRIENKKIIVIR